ncbi:hypothetical protein BpHYR1_052476 [Brachionus plicatilis]|uniref:Uncharacterized protein n=1 Tax=Brachionus plicatilis TaxID=10195 RepID=A0A3M7T2I3_BRAPC|nr:hypothetical protein BpHYR1_052476 [Brachionus plicatilis]
MPSQLDFKFHTKYLKCMNTQIYNSSSGSLLAIFLVELDKPRLCLDFRGVALTESWPLAFPPGVLVTDLVFSIPS